MSRLTFLGRIDAFCDRYDVDIQSKGKASFEFDCLCPTEVAVRLNHDFAYIMFHSPSLLHTHVHVDLPSRDKSQEQCFRIANNQYLIDKGRDEG